MRLHTEFKRVLNVDLYEVSYKKIDIPDNLDKIDEIKSIIIFFNLK
jgi:hypothetical protein